MKKNQRKKLFINPKFQIKFLLFVLAMSGISILSLYALSIWFFWKLKTIGREFKIPIEHPFFIFISQQELLMYKITIVIAIFVFFLIFFLGLYLSHRIAGSIYRFTEKMRQLKSLDGYKPMQFRKKDFFKELATEYNLMMERLRTK